MPLAKKINLYQFLYVPELVHWQSSPPVDPHLMGSLHLKNSKKTKKGSQIKKPYQCPKCDKAFALKCSKGRHLNYECGLEKRMQCPYCTYRSKQTSPMYAHIRRKHSGKDVYVIDLKV